jgi:hypothetical protein
MIQKKYRIQKPYSIERVQERKMWGYFQLSAIKSGIQTTKSISLIPTKFQTSNSMPCSPAQILNNSKLSLFLGTVLLGLRKHLWYTYR